MEEGVKKRLIQFIEFKRLSKNKFEELCGLSKRYVSNISVSIQPDKVKKISLTFPELNMGWLLTGEGRMINGPYERMNSILEEEGVTQKEFAKGAGGIAFFAPTIYKMAQKNQADVNVLNQWVKIFLKRFPKYSEDWIINGTPPKVAYETKFQLKTDRPIESQSVPLFNYDATAGLVAIFNDHHIEATDYLRIPNLPPVDGAIYVRGESMAPLLKSGDIVMYKKKELSIDSILWGEIYLLSFVSDGDTYTAVKYIRKSERPDYVCLASFNPAFAPMDIPMSSITALALVKASLTFHTME